MQLWLYWFEAIWLLRPACSRLKTFMWFIVCVAGLTIRSDLLGVTSIIRALGIHEKYYQNILDNFHSPGIKLSLMTALWAKIVLRLFPNPVVVNGRLVLVGDGLKVGKEGKKMPAVKLLHQQSESNTKPEYIMGHSIQAVSLLIQASNSFLAVPLNAKIHEGIVFSNRHKRTLLDKMLALLVDININQPYYFVADAYYACQKMVKGLLKQHNHLIARAKSKAVAYEAYVHQGAKKPGRPKLYGKKIALKSLFSYKHGWEEAASPVYGEKEVAIALRHSYPQFLLDNVKSNKLVKFIGIRLNPDRMAPFGVASG